MANTIGTLSIDVLANIASLVSDLGRAQQATYDFAKHAKDDCERATASIESVADGLKKVAELAGIGFGVEGIREITAAAFEAAERVNHLTQSLGVSAQTIQTVSFAAGKVGTDMETASNAFAKLERSAEQAAAGSAQQVEAFRAIGISASQMADLLKRPDELLQTVAQHLSSFGDGAGKTAVVMQLFGRNAQQIIPLLNELGGGFEELEQQAAQFGLLLSGNQLKVLQQTQEEFNLLGQQIKGVGNELAGALAPALQSVVKDMGAFLQSQSFKNALQDIGGAAKLVADNLGLIVTTIELLLAKSAVQWLIGVAGGIASVAKEAAIGATVWAEFVGGTAAAEAAMAGITAGAEALLAAIGGLPGLLAIIGVGIYELATSEDSATKATASLKEAQDLLNHTAADSVTQDLAVAEAAKKKAAAEIADAEAMLSQLEAQNRANASIKYGAMAVDQAALAYLATAGRIDELRAHVTAAKAGLDALTNSINAGKAGNKELADGIAAISASFKAADFTGNSQKYVHGVNAIHDAADQMIKDGGNVAVVQAQEKAAIDKLSMAFDAAGKAQVDYNAKAKETKQYVDESGAALLAFQAKIDELSGKAAGPYVKALDDYNAGLIRLQLEAQNAAIAGANVDQVIALWQQGEDALKQTLDTTNAKIREQGDAVGIINTKFQEHLDGIKGVTVQQKIEKQYLEDLAIAQKAWNASMGVAVPMTEEYKQKIHDLSASHIEELEAAKKAAAVEKEWQSIVENGFGSVAKSIAGFATGAIKSWKDFGKSLVDDAKQFIAAIIEQFLKLEVFNGIINKLFPAANLATGGMFSASGGGGLFSAGMGLLSTGGGSGGMMSGLFSSSGASGGSLLSPTTWVDAGKSLYNGFTSLFGPSTGAMSGGGSSTLLDYGQSGGGGTLLNYGAGGAVSPGMANPGFWGSGMSSYGGVLGIAGGVIAGVNEYKAAGGGLGGLAGGAAYGVGTAALAGAAGTAMSAGLAAGLASIPVVGWIALAAMFVNMISGGKLFGTAAKPIGGEFTETIGADGANLSSVMHEKGQRALFGGAYYKDKSLPIDAAAQKSADDFYSALLKGRNDFAAQFNVSMGDIIGGTFVQHFDKKGKPTTTDDTVLGVTYKNETQQQFAERLQSANYLAVLDKMGLGASKFVAALQGDADKLFAAVQDFAQTTQNIQINLGKGFQFLALGANETIVSVMKFVQGLQASGETLTQTYARLAQAQQQYNQFVAQFKPATVYVDPFEGSLAKLFDAMVAARKQANDLAIAAGASGASTEDLTNIQKAYAAQMAQLTIQLEASAQSLAFSLGLTTQGSLDQINQEIARLQGQIKPATTNVQNFGQAIQQVSQQATSAMNLLLGNLSPLNDQQKLQEALKGLQAGTVTKEQVLQIGRNLYASSEAYTQLFNMVSHMGGGGGGGYTPLGGGGNNAAGGTAGSSLSPSDAAKLKELLKEQATLQAAQTLGQYQTLAQQIVEIASAKGEDYMRVLEEMGIQSKDLEKGLGIKSDADLKAYLDKLQKQTDSAGQNTTSIVNAINALPSAIANAIAGKPTPVGGVLPHPAPPPTTPGGSGGGSGGSGGGTGPHGGHPWQSNFSPQEFGAAVATALSPLVQQFTSAQPRSGRVAMRV